MHMVKNHLLIKNRNFNIKENQIDFIYTSEVLALFLVAYYFWANQQVRFTI